MAIGPTRALEIVGLRAVFQDVNKFSSDAKRVNSITEQLVKSNQQLANQQNRVADSTDKLTATKNYNNLRQNLLIAQENLRIAKEQQKIAVSAARASAPTGPGSAAPKAAAVAAAKANTQAAIDQAEAEVRIVKNQIEQHVQLQRITNATISQRKAEEAIEATKLRQQILDKNAIAAQKEKIAAAMRLAALAAGAAVLGVGIGSVAAASSWEKQLTKINNLTQLTDAQTAELSKKLLDLGDNLPVSQADLAASAYFALSSGINDVDEALQIADKSAKLSNIGLGETADIAKFLTSTIVAYGEANLSAADASDLLISAVQLGQGEASDFANSLGRVIPVAANMGIELDEVLAVISSLTAGGLEATQATTGFLGILNQLLSPSKEAEDALASLGLTIGDVIQGLRDDAIGTLEKLAVAFENNPLFARKVFDETRGLNAFLSAFANNGAKTIQTLETMRQQGGETERAFAKSSQTFSSQEQILKNRLNRALIEIGTSILPTVNQSLKELILWITKNREGIVNFTQQGLRLAILFLSSFFKGIKLITGALAWIPANQAAVSAGLAAIGTALIWALPGGPYIKGLLTIITLLGMVAGNAGKANLTTGQRIYNAAVPLGLGVAGGIVGFGLGGPVGALAGFGVGTAAGTALTGLSGFNNQKTNSSASAEFDASEQYRIELDKLTNSLNLAGKTTDDFGDSAGGAGSAADEAAEKLKSLAETFKSTGEEAGKAESLTADMKLFGEVSKDVADAFNLDAAGAGAVQALDAVIRAEEKASEKNFEYAKTLATVANALQYAGNIAEKIVRNLAQSSLEASRNAVSAIFGRPTREVANLQLQVAERKPGQLALQQNLTPQIKDLNNQLDDLKDVNKGQIDAINDQIDAIKKATDDQVSAIDDQIDQIKDSSEARVDALNDTLDALKDAEDTRLEQLEHQIDQEQDAYDALKDIKDAEIGVIDDNIQALQDMLQESMSAEDRAGIEENIRILKAEKAAKEVEIAQSRDNLRSLKKQKDDYEEATDAQIKALEEQIDAIKEATDDQVEVLQKQKEAITDASEAQVEALQNQSQALEDNQARQEKVIQDQIDTLQGQIDKYDEVTQKLQDQIDMFEAEHEIMQRQLDLDDQTLLSEQELKARAEELGVEISGASEQVRNLSAAIGVDLVPEVQAAREAYQLMTDAVNILNDVSLRQNLIPNIDAASARADILQAAEYNAAGAADSAAGSLGGLGSAVDDAAGKIKYISDVFAEALTKEMDDFFNQYPPPPLATGTYSSASASNPDTGYVDKYGYADGGLIRSPIHGASLAENGIEAVLPLTKPKRAREIIASIPPSLASQIFGGFGGQGQVSVQTGNVTIMDPRKNTGPIGDMAYSVRRALISRGVS